MDLKSIIGKSQIHRFVEVLYNRLIVWQFILNVDQLTFIVSLLSLI